MAGDGSEYAARSREENPSDKAKYRCICGLNDSTRKCWQQCCSIAHFFNKVMDMSQSKEYGTEIKDTPHCCLGG